MRRVALAAAVPCGCDHGADIAFGTALFRVVREHKDPELRAQHGPVAIEEPRSSRRSKHECF